MHTMPMNGDGFPWMIIANIYNGGLFMKYNEGRTRDETIDRCKGVERLSIHCLRGRTVRTGAWLIYRDHLQGSEGMRV